MNTSPQIKPHQANNQPQPELPVCMPPAIWTKVYELTLFYHFYDSSQCHGTFWINGDDCFYKHVSSN
jgi:hypothetical protein